MITSFFRAKGKVIDSHRAGRVNFSLKGYNLRPYVPFWLLFALWVGAYWSALDSLLAEWISLGTGSYGHGLLVLAISSYFIWCRRGVLTPGESRLNIPGTIAVAALGFIWLVGFTTNTLVVQQLAAVLVFHVMVLSFFGFQAYRSLFFPLLLVFFAVPIWGALQDPLRALSVFVVHHLLDGLDMPILVQGYRLTLPGGVFIVERACSGLNFLLTSIVLSWIFCHLHGLNERHRIILIASSVCIAILANWLRIIIIVYVGNATNMQHFIVKDHLYLGWLIYGITLIPLFKLGYRLAPGGGVVEERKAFFLDLPLQPGDWRATGINITIVAALTVFFPVYSAAVSYFGRGERLGYDIALPAVEGAQRVSQMLDPQIWQPQFHGVSSQYGARYLFAGRQFDVYIANYQIQNQGNELIHFGNRLYSREKWWQVSDRRERIADAGRGANVRILSLQSNMGKKIIVYWYLVSGRIATTDLGAKYSEFLGVLRGRQGASVIAIAYDYKNIADTDAKQDIEAFVKALRAAISPNGSRA